MDKPQMKPVEKTDEDVSGALVNTRSKNGSVALAVNQINSFEQAEALADWIAQSPVFNKGFKEQVQKEGRHQERVRLDIPQAIVDDGEISSCRGPGTDGPSDQ